VLAIVESGAVGHFGTFNLNPVSACAAATAIGELSAGATRSTSPERLERAHDAFRSEATLAGFPVA
jgi:hypothetical protein